MPPVEIYSVNFASGTVTPTIDAYGWGDMRFGGSAAGSLQRYFGSGGLYLSAHRPLGAADAGVHHSVYVIPPRPSEAGGSVAGMLPLESRLLLRVEFDLPDAEPAGPDVKAEAWAVVLRLKLANEPGQPPELDVPDEAMINVTCQFNNDTNGRNGVRLNDPDRAQDADTNKAADLDSPLSYGRYKPGCFGLWGPTHFTLEYAHSGIQSGPVPSGPRQAGDPLGYSVGCGFLELRDIPRWRWFFLQRETKKDLRLFSSATLSTGAQSWIGALGVSLVTVSGQGTIRARLRRFAVSIWP